MEERTDMVEIKKAISAAVGEQRAASYFVSMKRFISAKISRAEFEREAVQVLSNKHVHLHNQLIHAMIRSTVARDPVPLYHKPPKDWAVDADTVERATDPRSVVTVPYSSAGDVKAAAALPQKLPGPESISESLKEEIERLEKANSSKHALVVDPGEMTEARSIKRMKQMEALPPPERDTYLQGWSSEASVAVNSIPDREALRARMFCLAAEHGIKNVSEEAVERMAFGMECYLKTVLETVARMVRKPEPTEVMEGLDQVDYLESFPPLASDARATQPPLSVSDLVFAAQLTNLLTEERLEAAKSSIVVHDHGLKPQTRPGASGSKP